MYICSFHLFAEQLADPFPPLQSHRHEHACSSVDSFSRSSDLPHYRCVAALPLAFRRRADPLSPLLSEAPRFKKGFIYSAVITAAQIGFTQVVAWFATREEHRNAEVDRLALAQSERSSTSSLKDEALESTRETDVLPVVERRKD